jgi:hypothetical protein
VTRPFARQVGETKIISVEVFMTTFNEPRPESSSIPPARYTRATADLVRLLERQVATLRRRLVRCGAGDLGVPLCLDVIGRLDEPRLDLVELRLTVAVHPAWFTADAAEGRPHSMDYTRNAATAAATLTAWLRDLSKKTNRTAARFAAAPQVSEEGGGDGVVLRLRCSLWVDGVTNRDPHRAG